MPDDADRAIAEDSVEQTAPDDANEAYVESPQTAGSRRRYLAAFVVTAAVVVIVLGLLPSALISMVRELRGQ